jgi:DNA-directed RNA polymerase subunit RPC12/RpoP
MRLYNEEDKYICHSCVSDKYVKNEIIENGVSSGRCSYCGSRKKTIDIVLLAEDMHKVFSNYYRSRTDGDLYPGYNTGDSAEFVISECLGVDDDVATDIHYALQESYNDLFDDEVYGDEVEYKRELPSSEMFDFKWREIKKSLQGEARFFNQKVKDFFDEIFLNIETFRTVDNKSAISRLTPERSIYRARVFEDLNQVADALKHPERQFGPPPQLLATSGRMNAQGISVFYGAYSPHISISEVRPAVGNYVVVAEFNVMRPLRILDISLLDNIRLDKGSFFDPQYVDLLGKISFLKTLSQKLRIPVSGKRTEVEYLITQAVAEYLSVLKEPAIDGITFKSTQASINDKKNKIGKIDLSNIVLFSKSSKVEDADSAQDRYYVNLIECYEESYQYRLDPTIQLIGNESEPPLLNQGHLHPKEFCLKLNTNKMVLHEIEGIIFQEKPHNIRKIGNR